MELAHKAFNPSQPRVPNGPDGGQWTSGGASSEPNAEETLRHMVGLWQQLGHDSGKDRWVLENGEQQDNRIELPGVKMGPPKMCYQNSFQALLNGKVDPAVWAYTEGSVRIKEWGFPIDHAWLSNKHGDVIDLTLRKDADASYYGVPMKWGFVRKRTMDNGYYGLLSNGVHADRELIGKPIGDNRAWPKSEGARKYSPDQPRAPKGSFNGGEWVATAEHISPENPPQPGQKFLAYRVGTEGGTTLENKNAGDARGVATYLSSAEDYEKPSFGNPLTTLHVFEVTTDRPFGAYSRMVGGRATFGAQSGTVGMESGPNGIVLSFGDSGYTAKHVVSIPVSEIRQKLIDTHEAADRAAGGFSYGGSFDNHGTLRGAAAIEAVVNEHLGKVTKYSDSQPRVPAGQPGGGQWTDGSAQGYRQGERKPGEKPEVAEVVHQYLSDQDIADLQRMVDDPNSTADQILDKLKPLDEMSKKLTPTIPEGVEPDAAFWNGREYVGGKSFSETLDALDAKAASYAGPDGPAQGREAVLMIGPPAAGKSTVAEALAKQGRYAIVDPDDAKKMIPEYAGGVGASAVHEESSLISSFSRVRNMAQGNNLILPVVGASPRSVSEKIKQLESWGYKTNVMLVDVNPNTAARRMAGRTLRTGRHISSSYARTIGYGPHQTYEALKGTSPKTGFARIDANGPRGSERYVESQGIDGIKPGSSVF